MRFCCDLNSVKECNPSFPQVGLILRICFHSAPELNDTDIAVKEFEVGYEAIPVSIFL